MAEPVRVTYVQFCGTLKWAGNDGLPAVKVLDRDLQAALAIMPPGAGYFRFFDRWEVEVRDGDELFKLESPGRNYSPWYVPGGRLEPLEPYRITVDGVKMFDYGGFCWMDEAGEPASHYLVTNRHGQSSILLVGPVELIELPTPQAA